MLSVTRIKKWNRKYNICFPRLRLGERGAVHFGKYRQICFIRITGRVRFIGSHEACVSHMLNDY
jgi:hypothetical protein